MNKLNRYNENYYKINDIDILCAYCFEDYGDRLPMGSKKEELMYCVICEHDFKVKENRDGTFTSTKILKRKEK